MKNKSNLLIFAYCLFQLLASGILLGGCVQETTIEVESILYGKERVTATFDVEPGQTVRVSEGIAYEYNPEASIQPVSHIAKVIRTEYPR